MQKDDIAGVGDCWRATVVFLFLERVSFDVCFVLFFFVLGLFFVYDERTMGRKGLNRNSTVGRDVTITYLAKWSRYRLRVLR